MFKKFIVMMFSAFLLVSCDEKNRNAIKTVEDLKGKIIGVQTGTTGEIFAADVENAVVKSFKTGSDAALALKTGAVNAIILDELPSIEIVRRNPTLKIIDQQFSQENYAVAVKKGNKALLDSVNETIKKIKSDGSYDLLVNSFINNVDGVVTVPKVDKSEFHEALIMGTNASFPPFEYTENGEIIGFDVSFAQIIAKNYGKNLKIVDMAFDGLISALQADAIDFIVAGMTATETRLKDVDFSEPYFSSNQVVIIKKDN